MLTLAKISLNGLGKEFVKLPIVVITGEKMGLKMLYATVMAAGLMNR